MQEPLYSEVGGLRYARPHWSSFAKACVVERQPLLDFMVQSLRGPHPCTPYAADEAFWRRQIGEGAVSVNEAVVTDPGAEVRRNDAVTVPRRHLHELPVPGGAVEVVFSDAEVVVANKPGGMPVSPDGLNYLHNALTHVLQHQLGLPEPLRPVHRIDIPSSGIVVLAKTTSATSKYSTLVQERQVRKCYVAKVSGRFPSGRQHLDTLIDFDKEAKRYSCVRQRSSSAKRAITTIKLQHYDEAADQSLVLAFPLTGRTHQIRVHLQSLGHPIVDDAVYNDAYAAAHPPEPNPFRDVAKGDPLPLAALPPAPIVGIEGPPSVTAAPAPAPAPPPRMPSRPGARPASLAPPPAAAAAPPTPPGAAASPPASAPQCPDCPLPVLRPHRPPSICLHALCYAFKNASGTAGGTQRWLTTLPPWALALPPDVLTTLGQEEAKPVAQASRRQRKRGRSETAPGHEAPPGAEGAELTADVEEAEDPNHPPEE